MLSNFRNILFYFQFVMNYFESVSCACLKRPTMLAHLFMRNIGLRTSVIQHSFYLKWISVSNEAIEERKILKDHVLQNSYPETKFTGWTDCSRRYFSIFAVHFRKEFPYCTIQFSKTSMLPNLKTIFRVTNQ